MFKILSRLRALIAMPYIVPDTGTSTVVNAIIWNVLSQQILVPLSRILVWEFSDFKCEFAL